jgi:hypothetical protein
MIKGGTTLLLQVLLAGECTEATTRRQRGSGGGSVWKIHSGEDLFVLG